MIASMTVLLVLPNLPKLCGSPDRLTVYCPDTGLNR